MAGAGVLAGAYIANQPEATMLGKPDSLNVGTSGIDGARCALDTATASMAKYWCSDLQCKVMDECVQLHGGYGYMWEYPITRAYADARVQRIYGGTNEIMKELISRNL